MKEASNKAGAGRSKLSSEARRAVLRFKKLKTSYVYRAVKAATNAKKKPFKTFQDAGMSHVSHLSRACKHSHHRKHEKNGGDQLSLRA